MKLWFDTETYELITEPRLRSEYESWLKDVEPENGIPYMLDHWQDFSFDAYIENCQTINDGTLMPVANAEYFKEATPDA